MPDVVEPEPRHVRHLNHPAEHPAPEVVGAQWSTCFAGEDQLDKDRVPLGSPNPRDRQLPAESSAQGLLVRQ